MAVVMLYGCSAVEKQLSSGKMIPFGRDVAGRPVIIIVGRKFDTTDYSEETKQVPPSPLSPPSFHSHSHLILAVSGGGDCSAGHNRALHL
jgi:hypothetical protein